MRKLTMSIAMGVSFMSALTSIPAIAGPYEDGLKGDDERNYAVSFPAFQIAAAEGHAKAHLKLGNHYTYGKGTKKSLPKAIKAYEKAAELGEPKGLYELGYIYQEGLAGVAESRTKALEWYQKAAEAGYYPAQFIMGGAYRHGNGREKNDAKAAYWYGLAAAQGHAVSQAVYNDLTAQGVMPWQPPAGSGMPMSVHKFSSLGLAAYNKDDYATALKYWRPSAEAGQSSGQYNLGFMYEYGYGLAQSDTEALVWYRRALAGGHNSGAEAVARVGERLGASTPPSVSVQSPAVQSATDTTGAYPFEIVFDLIEDGRYAEALQIARPAANAGNAKAQRNMGFLYLTGKGVPETPSEAFKWFEKSALQGEAYSQNKMAEAYYHGTGVTPDPQKYRYWVEKAANNGNQYAQFSLGVDYYNGEGVPQSNSNAFTWYLKAAEQGYASAQENIAIMFEAGIGVSSSDAQAAKWARKAADQGRAQSQYNLGIYYLYGRGVPKSYNLALGWFTKAANQDYPEAQLRMAYAYYEGDGVSQSNYTAAQWAEKSAVQGFDHAQYLTAMFYELGIGVTQNENTGLSWYKKAAAHGHVEAREAVQFYNAKMSESRVNTVGALINMDKINKIREERKRCMRPIGTTDALRQKRLQTGQTYEWRKPYGCP